MIAASPGPFYGLSGFFWFLLIVAVLLVLCGCWLYSRVSASADAQTQRMHDHFCVSTASAKPLTSGYCGPVRYTVVHLTAAYVCGDQCGSEVAHFTTPRDVGNHVHKLLSMGVVALSVGVA